MKQRLVTFGRSPVRPAKDAYTQPRTGTIQRVDWYILFSVHRHSSALHSASLLRPSALLRGQQPSLRQQLVRSCAVGRPPGLSRPVFIILSRVRRARSGRPAVSSSVLTNEHDGTRLLSDAPRTTEGPQTGQIGTQTDCRTTEEEYGLNANGLHTDQGWTADG